MGWSTPSWSALPTLSIPAVDDDVVVGAAACAVGDDEMLLLSNRCGRRRILPLMRDVMKSRTMSNRCGRRRVDPDEFQDEVKSRMSSNHYGRRRADPEALKHRRTEVFCRGARLARSLLSRNCSTGVEESLYRQAT